jgi:hypothetical protein
LKNQNLIKANENLFSQPESAARRERFIRVILCTEKGKKNIEFFVGGGVKNWKSIIEKCQKLAAIKFVLPLK